MGARGTGELRHKARELLVYMGNVGLGDVMATPAQLLHWHQSQPRSFEAHSTQDERLVFLARNTVTQLSQVCPQPTVNYLHSTLSC